MTAWPTRKIDTTHLDQGSDSPAHARVAIKAMADTINAMIDAFGDPGGVATLDGSGLHPFRQMRGEVFSAAERTRLANLSERTAPPRPAPEPAPRPTPRGRKTFTTPDSGYWVAPTGVTRVRVQLRGGAAGDGGSYTRITSGGRGPDRRTTWRGGDGGGGGFIYFEIAVSPGSSYWWSVGSNGVDGTDGPPTLLTSTARPGTDGGDGSNTAVLGGTARGGKGGKRAVYGRNGADGADGTSSAPAGASGVSRHTQLTVPSPVSAGYIVIEWG